MIRIIETQAPETTESPEKTEQVETNTEDIYYQPLSLELLLIKPKMKSISLLQDHIEHATAHLICNNEFENGVQSNGESYALVIVEKDKKDGEKNVVDDNDETDDLYSIDEMLDWAVSILLVLVAGLVAIPPIAFALMFIVLCSMLLTTSGRILLREFIVVAIASCVIPFSIMGIRSLSDL